MIRLNKKMLFIIWAILIFVVLLLVLDFLNGKYIQENFYFGFFQNLISDIVASVLLGTLIAIYLSRRENILEKEKRKDEILRLLLTELNDNLTQMDLNETHLSSSDWINWEACLPGLKDETWKAISEGGEVRWLDDDSLGLLNDISVIYHHIATVKVLEIEFNLALFKQKAAGQGYQVIYLRPGIIEGYKKIRKYIAEYLTSLESKK